MAYINPYEREQRRKAEQTELQKLYAREEQGGTPASAPVEGEEPGVGRRVFDTVLDVRNNIGIGAWGSIEGIVDSLVLSPIGAVGGIFSSRFADTMKKAIQYNVTEDFLFPLYNDMHRASTGGEFDSGETSYLRKDGTVNSIARGIGGMLPAVAVSVATMGAAAPAAAGSTAASAGGSAMTAAQAAKLAQTLSTATMAAGATGQAEQEAYQDGADFYGGQAYGVLRGATEAATEYALGGTTKLITGGGKAMLPGVRRSVANVGLKRVAKAALEEGLEEGISESLDPLTRTTYKGKEALAEYADPAFYGQVLKAVKDGSMTGLVFQGTVGHAMGNTGKAADMQEIRSELNTLKKKKLNLSKNNKLTNEAYAAIGEAERENYRVMEGVLKKATPEKRVALMEEYGLSGKFDENGTMKADFAALLDRRATVGQTAPDGENGAPAGSAGLSGGFDRRTASVDAEAEKVAKVLSKEGREQFTDVDSLSREGQKNLRDVKRVMEVFRDISDGTVGEFVIAKESVSDNAYFDPETGYTVIGADALETGINVARKGVQSWFQTALHEATHGTEKTVAWFGLSNQLRGLEGGKVYNEMLKQLGNRGYFNGKAADIRAEVEKIARKLERGEALTDKQTAFAKDFMSESVAIMAEQALGNTHFARELLDADASAVEKLLHRIEAIKEALARRKDAAAKEAFEEVRKAEQMFLDALAEKGKRFEGGKIVGVSHKRKRETTEKSKDEVDNYSTIKEQLIGKIDIVNRMEPVYSLEYRVISKEKACLDAIEESKKKGFQIERLGLGTIEISEDRFNNSKKYENTPAEFAAWLVVPTVLKRGTIIDEHPNHKDNGKHTYTIAAPVIINGVRANVAVIVKETTRLRYRSHRVVLPDGSKFILKSKKNAEPTGAGLIGDKHQHRPTISSASKGIIHKNMHIVNPSDEISSENSSGNVKKSKKTIDPAKPKDKLPTEAKLPEDPRTLELRGDQRKALANWSRNKVYTRKDAMEIVDGVIKVIGEIAAERDPSGERFHAATVLKKIREKSIDQLFADLNTAATPTDREKAARKIAEGMFAEARVEVLLSENEVSRVLERRSALQQYHGQMDLSAIEKDMKDLYGNGKNPLAIWQAKEQGQGMTPEEVKTELAEKAGIMIPADSPLDIVLRLEEMFNDTSDEIFGTGRYLLKDSLEGEEYERAVNALTQEILDGFAEKGHKSAKAAMQEEHERQISAVRAGRDRRLENQKKYYIKRLENKESYFQGRLDSQEKYWRGRLDKKETYFQGRLKAQRDYVSRRLDEKEQYFQKRLDRQYSYYEDRLDRKESYFQKRISNMKNASQEQIEWYRNKNNQLRTEVREGRITNRAMHSLQYELNRFKDWKSGHFRNATQAKGQPDILERTVGKLAKMTYRGNLVLNVETTRRAVRDLWKWYQEVGAENNEMGFLFDTGIVNSMQEIGYGEGALSADELTELVRILRHVKKVSENYQKFWKNGQLVDALPEAKRHCVAYEVRAKLKSKAADFLFRRYGSEFGEPTSLFRHLDGYQEDGFLTEMHEMYRKAGILGQLTEYNLLKKLDEVLIRHKGYLMNASKRTVRYMDGTRKTFDMPATIATAVHMALLTAENAAMLADSGFGYADPKTGTPLRPEGFMPGENPYYTDPGPMRGRVRAEVLNMAYIKAAELWEQFTEADKDFIKACGDVLYECGKLKEATDIRRLGISNVMKNGYFPAQTAYNAQEADVRGYMDSEVNRVDAKSFNKHRTEGNRHELWFEPLDTIIRGHAHGIAMYSALSEPIDTYNMLLNLETRENPNKPTNIASQLDQFFPGGKEGREAFMKSYINGVQGISDKETSDWAKTFEKIRGNVAVAAITGNLKVLLSQVSSYFAAANVIDAGMLVKGLNLTIGRDVDEYSTLAMLRHKNNEAALAQGVLDKLDGVHDFLSKPIGWMDRRVVVRLFTACQYQIAKDKKLKLGTEENKKAAGELLERVILETQQNALATEKSAAMRSKNPILRTFVMFSADSMKQMARLLDGLGEIATLKAEAKFFNRGVNMDRMRGAQKKTARAAGVLAVQAVYMVAIAQLIQWALKKNEDKEPEEIAKDLAVDFFGSILGGLPVIRDIYDGITQGYGTEDMSISAFNDMVSSVKDLLDMAKDIASGELTGRNAAGTIRKALYAIGNVAGIPVRNVDRYADGLIRWVAPNAAYKKDNAFSVQPYRSDIAKAIEREDEGRLETVIGVMLDENVGEVTSSAVRQEMKRLVVSGMDVLPRGVGDTVTVDGEAVKLTTRQKTAFKAVYSEANKSVERMVGLAYYSNASDEAKAKAIKRVYGIYYNRAIEDLLGVELENKNTLLSRAINPEVLAVVLAVCGEIAADVGKDGKVVAGSKRKKVEAFVESLKLKAAQKYMIMGALGYKNKKGREKVLAYVNGLGLSKSEREAIMAYSGY